MPLVPASCPKCGGKIQVNSDDKTGICSYCRTPFVTEDAVNNYYTFENNHTSIDHADTVIVNDDSSVEQKLQSAESFLTIHRNYNRARKLYEEVTELKSGDYRGWWGIVRAYTNDFSKIEYNPISVLIQGLVNSAMRCAPPDKKQEMTSVWNEYLSKERQFRSQIDSKVSQHCSQLKGQSDNKIEEINAKLTILERENEQYNNQLLPLKEQSERFSWTEKHPNIRKVIVVLGVLSIILLVTFLGILISRPENISDLPVFLSSNLGLILFPILGLKTKVSHNKYKSLASERALISNKISQNYREITDLNMQRNSIKSTLERDIENYRSSLLGQV